MTGGNPRDSLLSRSLEKNTQQVQLRWEALCFIIPSGASSTNGKRETEIRNLNFSRCLLCYGVCYRYFVRRYNEIRCQKYVSKLSICSSVMLMTALGKSRRHAFTCGQQDSLMRSSNVWVAFINSIVLYGLPVWDELVL